MGANTFDLVALSILPGLLSLGAVLVWLAARRRRSGAQSYCAGCDYALHGLSPTTTRCPECGTDLTEANSTVTGRRQGDRLLALTSLVMLILAIAIATILIPRAYRRAMPVNRVVVQRPIRQAVRPYRNPSVVAPIPPPAPPKPFDGVSNSELADAILVEDASGEDSEKLDSMLIEARSRAIAANESNDPSKEWIHKLVQAGLDRHVDKSRTWPDSWAIFVESLQQTMDFQRWKKYLYDGVQIDATFRDSMYMEAPFAFEYQTRTRLSPELVRRSQCRLLNITLGEITNEMVRYSDPTTPDKFKSHRTYTFRFTPEQWAKLSPGPTKVRMTVLVTYAPRNLGAFDQVVQIEKPITILPNVDLRSEYTAGLDEQVMQSLSVSTTLDSSIADGLRWDGTSLRLSVACSNAPADIFADLQIVVGNTQHWLGSVHWRKGESGVREIAGFERLGTLVGQTVNVYVIGSPMNAQGTLLTGDWWRGHVQFHGVTMVDERVTPSPGAESVAVPEVQVFRPRY